MRTSFIALICTIGLIPAAETSSGFPIINKPTDTVAEVYNNYQQNFGFVPNLAKVMANSPALMRSYWQTQNNIQQYASLSPEEINVVQTAIAFENQCRYCVSAHTMVGKMIFQTSDPVMVALRNGGELPDARLQILAQFARQTYIQHGHVAAIELETFLAAGYTHQQALDVIACIAAKVMSNLTNALGKTEIDAPFAPLAEDLNFAQP